MVGVAKAHPGEAQDLITRTYGVPLADVLALDLLAKASVVAGAARLDRLVTGLAVVDDDLDTAKPHDLLVATGPLPEVGRVSAHDFAGVATHLEVPAETVARADGLGLPVVRLPDDVDVDTLSQQLYALLNQRQAGVLERIDALHYALSQIVLGGGSLDDIAAETCRVLGIGILVTSTDGRERAAALPGDLRRELTARDLFDPTGRFRVERASARPLPFAHGEVRLFPVAAAGADLARLVCCSADRPLAADDVHAMERAATVAALLVTRQQAVTAVENKYQGDFLRDVFLGRAGDEAFVIEHAATFGWDLDRPMVVLSAEVDPPDAGEEPVSGRVRRAWQERFSAAWRQVCAAHDPSIPTVDFSTEVVSLLPVPSALDDLRAFAPRVVEEVAGDRGGGRRPFSVGVSRVVTSLSDLPGAYTQARRATEVGRRISGCRSTTWFDDLGLHRLLALVPDPAELRDFAQDVLADLAKDTGEAADLRTTLQVLLDTNLNVAEAARQQFFHYNTMRYRVSKLERMVGPFTTDPHLRLNVAVALQVLQMRA
jgi:PucR family transcriptional regulator, purine catabolism regulatory protein